MAAATIAALTDLSYPVSSSQQSSRGKVNAGLLAELADAVDSKSVDNPSGRSEKPSKTKTHTSRLPSACPEPADADLHLVVDAWPTLPEHVRAAIKLLAKQGK